MMSPETITVLAESAGFKVGNYGRVTINSSNTVAFNRGIGVLVLDEVTGLEIEHHSFDTHGSKAATSALVEYVLKLPTGRIVVVVVKDEAVRCLNNDAKVAMSSLGAALFSKLTYRGSYVLIGKKGATPGTPPEVLHNNDRVSLKEKIMLGAPETVTSVQSFVPMHEKQMLSARSAGYFAGSTADILVDSNSILIRKTRGLNVVVFTDNIGSVLYERCYDTYQSEEAADDFAALIEGLPDGRVVAIACMDDCTHCLNENAQKALANLGSELYKKMHYRSSYALIGEKGAKPGSGWEAVDPLAPVILNKFALEPFKTKANMLTVRSAGYYAGNTAEILIGKTSMLLCKGRGLNVLAIEDTGHLVIRERTFDTYASAEAANQFAAFITSQAEGCVVAIACLDECSRNIKDPAKKALLSIGGESFKKLKYRNSYAIVGEKGATPGSRPEYHDIGAVQVKEPKFMPYNPQRTVIVSSAGRKAGNLADVRVGSQSVLYNKSRGLNVVVMGEANCSILQQGTFDTYYSDEAVEEFVDFVERQSVGDIVVIACKDDCSARLNDRAYAALASLGGEAYQQLKFRSSYALIGKKGAAVGSRPEVVDANAVVSLMAQL